MECIICLETARTIHAEFRSKNCRQDLFREQIVPLMTARISRKNIALMYDLLIINKYYFLCNIKSNVRCDLFN